MTIRKSRKTEKRCNKNRISPYTMMKGNPEKQKGEN